MFNYLGSFPLPENCIPLTLLKLLTPISLDNPLEKIEITTSFNHDMHGVNLESLHMLMATVPESKVDSLEQLDEAGHGVVEYSTPVFKSKGQLSELLLSVSGYDYIVASWGNGSFYTYSLSEKVWMTLGLSPRVIGNLEQKIIYDDLSLPITAIAEGEVSNEFYWQPNRSVSWTMRNDYLRDYLWLRGHVGVRVFFYEKLIDDLPEVRAVMQGKLHYNQKLDSNWGEIDLREHNGKILLQVWASVAAIEPIQCFKQNIHELIWPGHKEPTTKAKADDIHSSVVYLKDTFLEKYEKNTFYNTTPVTYGNQFFCSPSYRGQWAFTECTRVGRNLIKTSIRSIYKAVPDQEILHAFAYAIPTQEVESFDLKQEHIVSKSYRLLEEILELGDNLHKLHRSVDENPLTSEDFVTFSRTEFNANGILHFPIVQKLAQVAPLEMYEQDFLSRCKTVHEIITKIKVGPLKKLLLVCGLPKKEISDFANLKLLQCLTNMLAHVSDNADGPSGLLSCAAAIDWSAKSQIMAPLFINNDLRIVDAHEKLGESMEALQSIGFDTKNVASGYGLALDFVLDNVINSLRSLNIFAQKVLQE